MDKPTLSSYIRDHLKDSSEHKDPGPFVTISRQFGCDGYEIGDLLAEKLNEELEEAKWKVFKREILEQVAEDAGISEEVIERERQIKPSIFRDFFRGVRGSRIPDSMEILKNITTLVRQLAFEGHSIIIGHGGTAATVEIENGLAVRVEAPVEWRTQRLCRRDGLILKDAEKIMAESATGSKHLDAIYKKWNPRNPAFELVMDNSRFSNQQIVEHIIIAMKQKKLLK